MSRFRHLRASAAVLVATLCSVGTAGVALAQTSLDATLSPYLAKYELPALAAAVVKEGEVVAIGAVGTRRAGTDTPVTVNDRFHLGSDTKAMTALLAGMEVEAGKLKWESTIADVFPELVSGMDPDLARVTLRQLLSHSSGLPADNQTVIDLLDRSAAQEGNLDELRYWLVREWRSQPLAHPAGSKFEYSNMNYVIAGAMIERVTGRTWEELITERVFEPLQLASAGLGPQASLGRVDAPLGHGIVDGKVKAFLPGPNGDNPLILGPAGLAHMSVGDFARWAGWNAGGGKRAPALVKEETLAVIQTPVIDTGERKGAAPGTPTKGAYAMGWGRVNVDWAPEPLLFHGGSNGHNLAHAWVDPSRDLAIVVMTNIGGAKADEACFALAPELFKQFGGSGAR